MAASLQQDERGSAFAPVRYKIKANIYCKLNEKPDGQPAYFTSLSVHIERSSIAQVDGLMERLLLCSAPICALAASQNRSG